MHHSSNRGVEDMVALEDLHDGAIMHNLFLRYQQRHIYVSFLHAQPHTASEMLSNPDGPGGWGSRWDSDAPRGGKIYSRGFGEVGRVLGATEKKMDPIVSPGLPFPRYPSDLQRGRWTFQKTEASVTTLCI
ncbi:hypothetical protein FQN60_016500, partial [Etheostoma spectabile]